MQLLQLYNHLLLAYLLIEQVSLSSFAFLFSEMVQYSQNRVSSIADLERK